MRLIFALLLSAGCVRGAPLPQFPPPAPIAVESWGLVRWDADEVGVLRARAAEIPVGTPLGDLPERLFAAMEAEGGVGLAAPQMGVSLRAAALKLGYRTEEPTPVVVINPEIERRSETLADSWEGCLSVPEKGGLVRRYSWIDVSWYTPSWEPQRARVEGADAILWQHELDHLDGVLYTDRLLGELLPIEEMRRRREAAAPPVP